MARPRRIAPDVLADLDLNLLRTFAAVARAGSISASQRQLRVRQPAISKSIASLERAVGCALFERGPRGVSLTSQGLQLLEVAERSLSELSDVLGAVTRGAPAAGGDLVIAAQEHIASRLLVEPLVQLRGTLPAIAPRVVTGASHLLLRELVEGRVELGLFFYLEPSSLVDRVKIAEVPARIVVATSRRADNAVLESFIGSREVDDLATRHYPTVLELQKKRPRTGITISSSSYELHRALVLAGAGVSIMPEVVVEDLLESGQLVVHRPDWVFLAGLELVTRRGHRLSKGAHHFVQLLRHHLRARGY